MTHQPDNLGPQKDLKPTLPATPSLNSAASGRGAVMSSGLGGYKGGENSKKTVIPKHLHLLQPLPHPTTKSPHFFHQPWDTAPGPHLAPINP